MPKAVPPGLRAAMETAGLTADGNFRDDPIGPVPEAVAAPLAPMPDGIPPAPYVAPAEPTHVVADAPSLPAAPPAAPAPAVVSADLGLTYGDEPSAAPSSEEIARAQRALATADTEIERLMRENARLKANQHVDTGLELPSFDVDPVDTDAMPREAFDQVMAVLKPAITSYVYTVAQQLLGVVDTRVAAGAADMVTKVSKTQFEAKVFAEIDRRFNINFRRVHKSREFNGFLDELAPGTTLRVGSVLMKAWDDQSMEVIADHVARFVARYQKTADTTAVTARSTAASQVQVGQGGTSLQTVSRKVLHRDLAEARRLRNRAEMARLMDVEARAEKAGTLVD